jgi:hypothetical protein
LRLALAILTVSFLAGCAGDLSPYPLPSSEQRTLPIASGGWIVTPRPDGDRDVIPPPESLLLDQHLDGSTLTIPVGTTLTLALDDYWWRFRDTPVDAPVTRVAGPGGWLPDWGVKCSSSQACHSDVTVYRARSQGEVDLEAEEDVPTATPLPFRVHLVVSTAGSTPSFEIPAKTHLVEEAGVVRVPIKTSLAIRFPDSTWRLQPVRGASMLTFQPDSSSSFLHVIIRRPGEAELAATQPGQNPSYDWDLIIDAII